MTSATGLVLTEPRSLERRSFDLPAVGADDGLLRVEACGLCGTDHEQYTGHITNRHAFIPGHEVIGIVEEVGDAAAERWGVSAGQRVAVEVFLSCRNCDQCRAGLYRRCERNGLATMVGFTDADTAPGLGGGYASHLYLRPDSMLMAVPDELDPVTATLFNPLGAGIRWAVEIPDTQPGDVVTILGPGVRGLCAAAPAMCLDALATTYFNDWFDQGPDHDAADGALILGAAGICLLRGHGRQQAHRRQVLALR